MTVLEEERTAAGRREWTALAVLALPLLLVSMDVSILYFAVPQISEDLHASATQQLWVLDIYGFVLAGLLVTMGGLADRWGARRVLLVGAAGFGAASLLAAYAGSAGELIAARALLGVAGATLMPSTMAMVRTLFHDPAQRAKAVAAWTGVMTGGIALGPVLSGVLLEHFWWGSVFLVNLPAMALLLLLGPALLPRGEVRRDAQFDLASAVLSLGAVLPAVYGVKEWAVHGLQPRWVLCLAVGLGLGAVLVRRQLAGRDPLVPAVLLRNRRYLGAIGANAIGTFALVGNAAFMTAYLQLVLGQGPLEAALWSLVPTVAVAAVAPCAPALAAHRGRVPVIAGGFAVGIVGFLVLGRVGTASLAWTLVGAGLLAAGLVTVMAIAGELVLGAVEPEQAGVGSAVSEAATELGGACGIALLGSVGAAGYQAYAGDHLAAGPAHGPALQSLAGAYAAATGLPGGVHGQAALELLEVARHAFVHGLHLAAVVGAAVLAVSAVALLLVRPRRP